MSKKKKRSSDTREFTALKNNKDKQKPEQPGGKMVFSDRAPKPSFEL